MENLYTEGEAAWELTRLCFRALGINWDAPRVSTFILRVEKKLGRPIFPAFLGLPSPYDRQLAIALAEIVLAGEEVKNPDALGGLRGWMLPHWHQYLIRCRDGDR